MLDEDIPNHKLFNIYVKSASVDLYKDVFIPLGLETAKFPPLAANRKIQALFNIGDKNNYVPFTMTKFSPYHNEDTDEDETRITCALKWKDDYIKVYKLLNGEEI